MEQTLKVALFGVTGYTGAELLRILARHPGVEVTSLVSSSSAGRTLGEVLPSLSLSPLSSKRLVPEPEEEFDLAFLCLPHEVSLTTVPRLLAGGKKVIDLSGAYRIKDPEAYPSFYGFTHEAPELLEKAVYGLPEIFREEIRTADLIANPGCYPTAALLALYPLLREGVELESIVIHALSGVSGAGRQTRQRFHFPEMAENCFPYALEKHRHTPEIEDVIERVSGIPMKVRFTPVVVPLVRGMLVTVYVRTGRRDLRELYLQTYANEPFVRVTEGPPMTKWVSGTNLCLLYPHYDDRTATAVIVSAIDNLGKGASLQAVQNMNLMFGFEETLSIPVEGLFP